MANKDPPHGDVVSSAQVPAPLVDGTAAAKADVAAQGTGADTSAGGDDATSGAPVALVADEGANPASAAIAVALAPHAAATETQSAVRLLAAALLGIPTGAAEVDAVYLSSDDQGACTSHAALV
jgi:hypothetical protein